MKLLRLLAFFVALPAHAEALKVVATVGDLGAIAREIGGDAVQVEVLAKPTQDPHFVDAKPSLVLSLSRAQLLLTVGMELEVGWLPTLLTSSRNGRIQPGTPGYLDCSTVVTPKEVPTQKLDRSMGDVHPGGNPHYTKDPQNAVLVARAIQARLAQLSPSHSAQFKTRADQFETSLRARIEEWRRALQPFKGTPVVTYHKSWLYFTEWAGLDEVGFIEPKPGLQPSAGHVAKVLALIKARKVPVLLQEDWYSAATSEMLARNTGATLVRVPGMAGEKQTYSDYFGTLVSEVVKALAGQKK